MDTEKSNVLEEKEMSDAETAADEQAGEQGENPEGEEQTEKLFTPVSYTHLDVYKGQAQQWAEVC